VKVNPTRKTPVNAIHLEVGMQVVALVCVLIWGVENVFFTWANAITIGLVLMYILANIGVVKYYLTEARSQFNPLLHVVVPLVASAAGVVVVWKSYFSPFTSSGPVYWGLLVFIAVLLITILAPIYLRVSGRRTGCARLSWCSSSPEVVTRGRSARGGRSCWGADRGAESSSRMLAVAGVSSCELASGLLGGPAAVTRTCWVSMVRRRSTVRFRKGAPKGLHVSVRTMFTFGSDIFVRGLRVAGWSRVRGWLPG
jgi:hypothetical protein